MISLVHLYCMPLAHYVNCSAYGLLQLRFLLCSWQQLRKKKDPPVSRRQVFLRSEHLRSARDPIRLYRSNVINAVQYVLLYASRTGRQLCFAATQQKVSPVGSIPFAGRVFPAHFASRIRPFHFSFRHSPNFSMLSCCSW